MGFDPESITSVSWVFQPSLKPPLKPPENSAKMSSGILVAVSQSVSQTPGDFTYWVGQNTRTNGLNPPGCLGIKRPKAKQPEQR